MKKAIVGFIVGLTIGLILASKNKQNPVEVTPSDQETLTQTPETPKNDIKEVKTPEPAEPEKIVLSIEKKSEEIENKAPTSQATDSSKPSSQMLTINISENELDTIERNISDLQKDVSLFKDSKGWKVRFYRDPNLIASLGINDNDIINFEQFNKLKTDPEKEPLINRLESVFSELER